MLNRKPLSEKRFSFIVRQYVFSVLAHEKTEAIVKANERVQAEKLAEHGSYKWVYGTFPNSFFLENLK